MHVRWSDLVRPEQSVQDGKGPETEASAFRNAYICDKRVVENEIRYGVAFGNQKHLPSRVMKIIVEVEQTQDGKEKYWFSELRIPLYLIKEYEEKVGKDLPSANKPRSAFTKKKPLRTPCKDIFTYLVLKRDGNDKYCCASCQADVPFRYPFNAFIEIPFSAFFLCSFIYAISFSQECGEVQYMPRYYNNIYFPCISSYHVVMWVS